MSEEKSQQIGIAGLPRVWAVAVQLVGTFGLAVFLVLYYVLVLQPAEAQRYEELANSVNNLLDVVRERQSLLTRDQAARLEELYVLAAGAEVARIVVEARERSRAEPDLARELENALMLRVDLLEGLTREDGGVLASQAAHKLRNHELPRRLAQDAMGDWREMPYREVAVQATNMLRASFRAAAREK